ncbi:MAG: alpha/beta hydrolase [Alphaproteobacteria bacterium]|nr:alpha/beta hydrolase [Alphaproteobacteria bacterium]
MTQFLIRENAPKLAYMHVEGENKDKPTIMFLGGFRSDMEGTKATYLEKWCEIEGYGYIRFDYRGHGKSGGAFEESCISEWIQDAQDILDHCVKRDPETGEATKTPVILIGSSMGGWISLLLALKQSEIIQALIGIAAAPDFTSWMERDMTTQQYVQLKDQGFFDLPNDYDEPYKITQKLLDDGRDHSLLNGEIKLNIPVRLIQGKKDTAVPWQTAEKIKEALSSTNIEIIYRAEGDHSLSTPEDLAVLCDVIKKL